MYLAPLKTAIVEALRASLAATYPNPDFANVLVDIEYPATQAAYPGVWVQFEDTEELSTSSSLGYTEVYVRTDGSKSRVIRWRYGGVLTLTPVALTSLERDRLYDELVRIIAFSRQDYSPTVRAFRSLIEANDLIGMNINFDHVRPSGDAATPGTPWGTEEIIYEKSLSVDVVGEFISDPGTGALVLLSKVIQIPYVQGTPEPPFPDRPPDDVLDPGNPNYLGPGTWQAR